MNGRVFLVLAAVAQGSIEELATMGGQIKACRHAQIRAALN